MLDNMKKDHFAGKSFDSSVKVVWRVFQWLNTLMWFVLRLACGLSLLYMFFFMVYGTEVYSEPCQTEMDPFAKIVNEWKLLTIFKNIGEKLYLRRLIGFWTCLCWM